MFAALGLTLVALILLGGIVFASAGRLDLPMVWVYLAVVLAVSIVSIVLMQRRDPALLKARMGFGPSDVPDRLYRMAMALGFLAHFVIAGLDIGRFHWSDTIPLPVQIAGLVGFVAGFAFSMWAALSNPFFTAEVRIQQDRGQYVVTGGPYQFVRHPGYTGGIVFLLSSGVALGSWLSVLPMLLVVATLIRRTSLEDQMLQQRLGGYADYARNVRFRLIPGIW